MPRGYPVGCPGTSALLAGGQNGPGGCAGPYYPGAPWRQGGVRIELVKTGVMRNGVLNALQCTPEYRLWRNRPDGRDVLLRGRLRMDRPLTWPCYRMRPRPFPAGTGYEVFAGHTRSGTGRIRTVGGGCVGCGSMPRRPERDPGGFPGRVCLPACASLAAEGADGQDGTPGIQGLATAGGGEALRTRWVAQGRGRVSTSQSTTRP